MRRKRLRKISFGILIALMASVSMIIMSSNAYATGGLQPGTDARAIFAASCATCHGAEGKGGVTWIKDSPADKLIAPRLVDAGLDVTYIKYRVRAGAPSAGMPAFGPEILTDGELNALANMIVANLRGIPAPPTPAAGPEVKLYILDADPWYSKVAAPTTPFGGYPYVATADPRRVALSGTEYVKIYNTGRTWHTFTTLGTSEGNKDSGFIGYAGNYKDTPGDLGDMGYYYASDSGPDNTLATGCYRYFCRMHPYMQVEVCTPGISPGGPTDVNPNPQTTAGLTRAHKNQIAPPTTTGVGEIWVTTQSQEEIGEDTTTIIGNSVGTDAQPAQFGGVGFDGTYQVIDASTWTLTDGLDADADSIINDVGNNPHNSWAGISDTTSTEVVLSASWHDNTVSLIKADDKTLWAEKHSGADNAHVMVTPGPQERFYITHMGGNALQEIITDNIPVGLNPHGQTIRGATSPHGLWMCDNGNNVLTADTFARSATLYNIGRGSYASASSGGISPLAPSIMSGYGDGCSRGFTNNAITHDVSVYSLSVGDPDAPDSISRLASSAWNTAGLDVSAYDNMELRNTTTDQAASPIVPETIRQGRWAHLPIQTPVSPMDATAHRRYMVTANKASFNVSITALDSTTGLPTALYTIPAGLGAHGVTYGQKSVCDDGTAKCYYSYVTNTFEDYISVYDLEQLEPGGEGEAAGSALLAETLYVEGGAIMAVATLDPVVASLCDVVDIGTTDNLPLGIGVEDLVYDLGANPGGDAGYGDILDCGIGPMVDLTDSACLAAVLAGGVIGPCSYYVSNLPIGVLCPDCRSGVHAGDVPLQLTTGEPLADSGLAVLTSDGAPFLGTDGYGSKYTYLKEEVYVDTDTVACVVEHVFFGGPGMGLDVNDCSGATTGGLGGDSFVGGLGVPVGVINTPIKLDLDLGINTGGQGIMTRDPVGGSAPAVPWP